ncbi:SPASM domain-containing protein [Limnohabitans sp.]|uniref:SPASM domain-containing protein n=1 Tax=Limnohabitans sp. TaxID=1907725 RepID=UPI0031203972
MSKQLRELQARKAALVKDARALTDIAAAEQRDMNEEEVSAFEALKARIEAASAAIDREAALIAEEAHMAMRCERFSKDVKIGEGAFIDPYDEGGLSATLQTHQDHLRFRAMDFKELRQGLVSRMTIAQQHIMDFVQSIQTARPASSVGQKCSMDRPDHLAVDLHGNVLTCQNVSAKAIAPNGQPHHIGQVSNLQAVKMRSATHWSQRSDCPSCPMLQICKGSCMFLEGKLWDAGCDAAYSDNVPFLAAAIEFMTGCIPYYIDGDFREDRKDIFGQIHGAVANRPRRVIPILAYERATAA